MPRAADHPTPSRRTFIGATTIGLLAGAPIAALAGAPDQSPDAELLGLLAEFEAVHRRINGLFSGGPGVAPGPNAIEDDDEREAATKPLYAQATALLDRITEIQAFTPEAWQAKARCLLLMDLDYREDCRGEGSPCEHRQLLGSLLYDLTGGAITELDIADTPLVAVPMEEQEPEASPAKLTAEERATLEAEDPLRARLGSPPFREYFPPWRRTPADLTAWLTAARHEFTFVGVCEALQRQGAAKLEELWRAEPETADETFQAFIGLSRRYERMATALHGETIRLAIAQIRARGDEPTDGVLAALATGHLIAGEARA